MAIHPFSRILCLHCERSGETLNQKGEVTLFFTATIVVLSLLFVLLALELRSSYLLTQKRKELFLCTKEARGDLKNFMIFTGRTNWGIKNAKKVALIAVLIPGLQGLSAEASKVKETLIRLQNIRLASYLNSLRRLSRKGCSLGPGFVITPFEISGSGFSRDDLSAARLRKKEWTYFFIDLPYTLTLDVKVVELDAINPVIEISSAEKGAMLSSLSSSL